MKRKPRETDEEFLDRIAKVRGALEDQFWKQASSLKSAIESLRPRTAVDKLRVQSARRAMKRANLAYLNEDLEAALASQAKVINIVAQIQGKSDRR